MESTTQHRSLAVTGPDGPDWALTGLVTDRNMIRGSLVVLFYLKQRSVLLHFVKKKNQCSNVMLMLC